MRIAFFTDSFYPELGGIQDSILLTARALGERGHTVVLYAPSASPRDFRLAGLPVKEVDLGERVQVRRLFSVPVPSSTGQSRPFHTRIARPARPPNTSPSSSELLARRFAPCTPVRATSPAAYNPRIELLPSRSVTTPPIR